MKRAEMFSRLRNGPRVWDVLIIGGGATGLGAAVDAASRGYRTVLLEQGDFAQGTSSRSTKLIHGGVRYLRDGNIPLVRQALRERELLMRNAPHLVRPLPFAIPAYRWWEKPFYTIGLKFYDLLGGRKTLAASHSLSYEQVIHRAPALNHNGLRGGVLFYDAQFDDARLAIALAQTAYASGAVVLNHCRVSSLIKENAKISGVVAVDAASGEQFEIRSRATINATGVFADRVRALDEPVARKMLRPSQGIHIVVERSFLGGETAVLIPSTDDRRVLFAIPWHNRVLIGTTDTPVEEIALEPRPLPAEIDYLMGHFNRYFTKKIAAGDVLSVFAGLRPLVKTAAAVKSAQIPRDHLIKISESGLITITGGKWTTYRAMAEEVIDEAAKQAQLPQVASKTAQLAIHNSGSYSAAEPDETLHPKLPYTRTDVFNAIRGEMPLTIADMLARRMRALFLDAQASIELAPQIARLMAAEMNYDENWQQQQIVAFNELARGYSLSNFFENEA